MPLDLRASLEKVISLVTPRHALGAIGVITLIVVIALLVANAVRLSAPVAAAGEQSDPPSPAAVARVAAPLATAPAQSADIKASSLPARAALLPAGPVLSTATMPLDTTIPQDEADNLRWSLIRRTPLAATIYSAAGGVNWEALRSCEAQGDILVPAGFVWSFNETFREGPGYKEASGILAGGHCALATLFNAAAESAGLPTQFNRHRTPFPGYGAEKSVNIYWGRDDLVVQNTSGQDIYLRWRLVGNNATVEVVSAADSGARPLLPSLDGAQIALTYGRARSGSWGTLGKTRTVDQAVYAAIQFADRVNVWNGRLPVVAAVNPNVFMAGTNEMSSLYIYHLIAEAERRGVYVMLDVQPGGEDPLQLFGRLMDRYLRENVWLDWDIEHTTGGRVTAEQINRVAAEYFRRRAERGYGQKGIFAFYVFEMNAVADPENIRREYDNGWVVPIFDGYGPRAAKLAKTDQFRERFAGGPLGIMEFETRWGTKYDGISAQEYCMAYPDMLIYASQ